MWHRASSWWTRRTSRPNGSPAPQPRELLRRLQADASALDWSFVSPPIHLEPARAPATHRLGQDAPVFDAAGHCRLSVADLAVAIVDEIEHPPISAAASQPLTEQPPSTATTGWRLGTMRPMNTLLGPLALRHRPDHRPRPSRWLRNGPTAHAEDRVCDIDEEHPGALWRAGALRLPAGARQDQLHGARLGNDPAVGRPSPASAR